MYRYLLNLFSVNTMIRHRKKSFFGRLMDKKDNSTSLSSFFIFLVLLIGILLLLVPVFAIGIESWFNHTVTSDIGGWAAYITAVAAIFTTAGLTKVGINYSDGKFQSTSSQEENNNEEENNIKMINEENLSD